MGAFDSKYQLITLQIDDEVVDFFEIFNTQDISAGTKLVSEFEQKGLNNKNIKYTFVESSVFNKMRGKSNNAVELIMKADNDLRIVEYTITKVDEESTYGLIQFSAPYRVSELIEEKSKQVYEVFYFFS